MSLSRSLRFPANILVPLGQSLVFCKFNAMDCTEISWKLGINADIISILDLYTHLWLGLTDFSQVCCI